MYRDCFVSVVVDRGGCDAGRYGDDQRQVEKTTQEKMYSN